MTLEEIEDTLPNGFHDARIAGICVDYATRFAEFDMEICISDSEEGLETYHAAKLTLSQLLYCVIEAPDSKYPYQAEKPLWVNAGSSVPAHSSATRLPEPLPEGAFTHWFFVNDWNSFIHVAAMDARLVLS